jgi:predicted DNA-binding protein (MmcQ/YjbR family)
MRHTIKIKIRTPKTCRHAPLTQSKITMSFPADDVRTMMLSKKEVTGETPFGPGVLVYKVCGKMFATLGFEDETGRMNLKCNAERALEFRDEHVAIISGYHMNKKHWNTLVFDKSLPASLVTELVGHSYELVVKGLPAKLGNPSSGGDD